MDSESSAIGSSSAQPQILLILVGLPGSGKTTFAEALVGHSRSSPLNLGGSKTGPGGADVEGNNAASDLPGPPRIWVRASQDDAPSRRRQECEGMVWDGLRAGHNVVVDRVGFDAVQRGHFISIAKNIQPPPRIYALILNVTRPTLENRLLHRPYHPTIKDAATAIRVLGQMGSQFQPPTIYSPEGFDRIYTLPEEAQAPGGAWTKEMLEGIIARIGVEGEVEMTARPGANGNGDRYNGAHTQSRQTQSQYQYRGGYRGRGRGNGSHGPSPSYHQNTWRQLREPGASLPLQGLHPTP